MRHAERIDGSNKSAGYFAGLYGSPVYDDTAVLNRWLDVTEKIKTAVVPRSTTRFHCMTATLSGRQQNSGLQSAGAEIL